MANMAQMNAVLEESAGMSVFFEEVALMPNPTMRCKVITNGFQDLEDLAKMDPEHAKLAWNVIRKSTGTAQTKDISTKQENVLKSLIQWCIDTYIVGRDVDLADATPEDLERVSEWFKLLEKNPDPDEITKFGNTADKRQWLDAMRAHFALKKGAAGVPISYVIRENDEGTIEEEGFGNPSFDRELHLNGSHDGHYFPMDNKLVYYTIKNLVLNSTAHSCIMRLERGFNGCGAFKALERNYMGPHVTQLIQRQGENIVNTSVFNGSSRNHTFDKHVNRL
jgi:hypothetical protein